MRRKLIGYHEFQSAYLSILKLMGSFKIKVMQEYSKFKQRRNKNYIKIKTTTATLMFQLTINYIQ